MSINTVRIILAALVVVGVFALLGIALFEPVKGFEIEVIDAMIGALLTAFAGIIAYYFRG